MKRYVLHLMVLALTTGGWVTADCQYYFYNENYYESSLTWETGFAAGGMNCLTDLGGRKGIGTKFIKDINWNATCPGGSLFVGANYQDLLTARLELAFGQVSASDDILKNDKSQAYARYIRNLNFRSDIKELSFALEIFPFAILKTHEADLPFIYPYAIVGIGYFSFRPKTFYNNTWIDVSALHTEGQGFKEYPERKPYKLSQLNIPAGLGLKYEFSPVLNFNAEVIYRKLWTDYLDDVSKDYVDPSLFQKYFTASKATLAAILADRRLGLAPGSLRSTGDLRGNARHNDAFFSVLLKVAFIIGRQRRL